MTLFYQLLVITLVCFVTRSVAECVKGPILESGLNEEQQKEVVDRHNHWRTQIAQGLVPGQPKSSDMLRMVWDSQLAVKAQELADTCVFKHVIAKDPRFWWVGQNLYTWWATYQAPANWTSAVDAWFNEVTKPGYTYPIKKKGTGHYTQVVWSTSYALGCGYTGYQDKKKGYGKLYACNYGPGGNIRGVAPYKTGDGCENLCDPPTSK